MIKYLKPQYFDKIQGRLANLFIGKDDAEIIARNATLNVTEIGFSNKAINTWDAVLSRAEKEDKVLPLIKSAISHYNGDAELSLMQQDVESGAALEIPLTAMSMGVQERGVGAPELLMIYNNVDTARCTRQKKQFAIFEMNEELLVTDFQSITSGEIIPQRQELLARASIVMPVISPDFFDADENFMPFVRNAIQNGKKLVPLLLVRCPYARVKVLKEYVSVPGMDQFINELPSEELGYSIVAEKMTRLIDELNNK